jgi:hypothetical protein
MNVHFLLSSAALLSSVVGSGVALADSVRVSELKALIEQIALENQARIDNFAEVRSALDPLVDELVAAAEPLSFEESKALKVGAWQQLWTDDADDLRANNAFQKVDRSQTYQVVFPNGVFYNLSELQTPLGRFSGFLRGTYSEAAPLFLITFTDLQIKRGQLGMGLYDLVGRVEDGAERGLFRLPGNQRYPDGPIGAEGDIDTVFIDDELRIDIGRNLADGVKDLFVLVRSE